MGFQFQSIAAVGPLLANNSGITYTQLGALIGIYLLPGILFAIPGGWLGKHFGEKRVVLIGLAMMTLGGLAFIFSSNYEITFAGRLVSGLGAILLNVLITKMVTDWFAEHRIALAMGLLISSWPLGIAIALMTMGPLEQLVGLKWAFALPVVLCIIAFLLVRFFYRNPPDSGAPVGLTGDSKSKLSRYEFWGAVLSGGVWCLYNVAFILPLSFGAAYLVSKGETLASAGAIISLVSWIIIPALPLGALIAERTGRPMPTIIATFLGIAVLLWIIPLTPFYIVMFASLGFIFGPAGGLIMALPSQVLSKENRAIGMGVFFTVYYAGMGVVPAIAGYALDATGNPAAPFTLGVAAILLAVVTLAGFHFVKLKQANHKASIA